MERKSQARGTTEAQLMSVSDRMCWNSTWRQGELSARSRDTSSESSGQKAKLGGGRKPQREKLRKVCSKAVMLTLPEERRALRDPCKTSMGSSHPLGPF
eukprot:bmy_03217T0